MTTMPVLAAESRRHEDGCRWHEGARCSCGVRHLFVKRETQPETDLPDRDTLAAEQYADAMARLELDAGDFPHFPLPTLYDLAGAHAPDELWLWMARQANGKSLAMQNYAHWLVEQEVPTLYIGTEQDAHVLRVKQACVREGVKPRLVLKPKKHEIGTTQWQAAMDAVADGLKWLDTPEVRELLIFANTRYVDRAILSKWVTGGVRKYGVLYVIVDHIDHMSHGDGRNAPSELRETVHLCKDLACRHQIGLMAASQVSRAGDPMRNFMPPCVDDGFGSSAKEQTADIILGAWRPLRTDLDHDALRKLLKQGQAGHTSEDRVYQPDTMGVRLLKDRLGDAPGSQTMLRVDHGRLMDRPLRTDRGGYDVCYPERPRLT